ncbi:hypothetical protein BJ165DRAFT_1517951 [Panaeolus papilionaceus]|nr:hypothetical protein BJ165DRAFT_1517951 [Panaeolus papilionaceus]
MGAVVAVPPEGMMYGDVLREWRKCEKQVYETQEKTGVEIFFVHDAERGRRPAVRLLASAGHDDNMGARERRQDSDVSWNENLRRMVSRKQGIIATSNHVLRCRSTPNSDKSALVMQDMHLPYPVLSSQRLGPSLQAHHRDRKVACVCWLL